MQLSEMSFESQLSQPRIITEVTNMIQISKTQNTSITESSNSHRVNSSLLKTLSKGILKVLQTAIHTINKSQFLLKRELIEILTLSLKSIHGHCHFFLFFFHLFSSGSVFQAYLEVIWISIFFKLMIFCQWSLAAIRSKFRCLSISLTFSLVISSPSWSTKTDPSWILMFLAMAASARLVLFKVF